MDCVINWLEAVESELESLQQLSSTVENLENQLSDLKVLKKKKLLNFFLLIYFSVKHTTV